MNVITIIETIFLRFKDIIVTWFSVLTRGRKAIEEFDLEKSSTLIYALKFMFLMAFVDLIVNFPLAAKIGGSTLTVVAIPPFIVAEYYIEYLTIAFVLHGSMKLVGGKGGLQSCIAAFCFLTAYLPLMGVLMLPERMITVPAILESPNYIAAVYKARHKWDQLSTWDRSSVALSFLLATAVLVLFFTAVFQQFRALHQLNKPRAVFAFIGGLVGSAVIMAMFLEPPLSALFRKLVE
jgi:hypothetical protein